MTVKPILFSAPMVRAILREVDAPSTGKTMTRRIIPQPEMTAHGWHVPWQVGGGCVFDAEVGDARLAQELLDGVRWQAGDVLWVREGWRTDRSWDTEPPRDIIPAGVVQYEATGPTFDDGLSGRVRPGIHMPRWASRLTLTVEEVRVERLQDISEADARAEGVEATEFWDEDHPPSICFSLLWDSINGARSWATNPFVAAISFRPHLINVDAYLANPEPRP